MTTGNLPDQEIVRQYYQNVSSAYLQPCSAQPMSLDELVCQSQFLTAWSANISALKFLGDTR